jgi:uncharacterized protein (DUF488 family)
MNKLYTIGYHALRGVYALLDQAVPLDATIIDIRMKPWSRRSDWTQESLLKRLCDLQFGGIKCRYVHIQELGNVNYNRDGYPIQLLHEEYGIARLHEQLKFKPAILLCQCPHLEECHRKVVADLAIKWLGCEVEHLAVSRGGWAVRTGAEAGTDEAAAAGPAGTRSGQGQMSLW